MHASPNLHATHSPHAFCSGGAGGDGREGGAEGGPGGAGGKGGAEGGAHWGQPSQCSQWHSSSHDRVLFAQNGWQVPMGGPWTLSRRGSAISLGPWPSRLHSPVLQTGQSTQPGQPHFLVHGCGLALHHAEQAKPLVSYSGEPTHSVQPSHCCQVHRKAHGSLTERHQSLHTFAVHSPQPEQPSRSHLSFHQRSSSAHHGSQSDGAPSTATTRSYLLIEPGETSADGAWRAHRRL